MLDSVEREPGAHLWAKRRLIDVYGRFRRDCPEPLLGRHSLGTTGARPQPTSWNWGRYMGRT